MSTTLAAPRNLAAEENGRAAAACHDRGVTSGADVNATCDGSSDSATTSWSSTRANMTRPVGAKFASSLVSPFDTDSTQTTQWCVA